MAFARIFIAPRWTPHESECVSGCVRVEHVHVYICVLIETTFPLLLFSIQLTCEQPRGEGHEPHTVRLLTVVTLDSPKLNANSVLWLEALPVTSSADPCSVWHVSCTVFRR